MEHEVAEELVVVERAVQLAERRVLQKRLECRSQRLDVGDGGNVHMVHATSVRFLSMYELLK